MKKRRLVILCLFLTLSNITFSQIQKGKVLLSGASYFTSSEFDDYELGASVGYFVSNKSAIGLSFSLGSEAQFDFYGVNQVLTHRFSAFARQYLKINEDSKFYFLLQESFNYESRKLSPRNPFSNPSSDNFTYIQVSPGLAFFLADFVGIELSLNGILYAFPSNDGDATFIFDLRPLNPTLSVTFLLGKKN